MTYYGRDKQLLFLKLWDKFSVFQSHAVLIIDYWGWKGEPEVKAGEPEVKAI